MFFIYDLTLNMLKSIKQILLVMSIFIILANLCRDEYLRLYTSFSSAGKVNVVFWDKWIIFRDNPRPEIKRINELILVTTCITFFK